MAIKNASDLLVYAKTASAAAQVTRIRVLTTNPISVPEGGTTGTIKVNNLVNVNGQVYDDFETSAVTNSGAAILSELASKWGTWGAGSASSSAVDGDYTYRDFTSSYSGLAPTLEIVSGTATLNEGAIIIEIVTPGSLAIFDPVAFSTSASFSTNVDLRDVTNKDSNGWSESLGGLKSFEVSTDVLQSINPDVPLDGTDFFDKLKNRSLVDLSFSDRIRNIIRTNLTQSGVDGFTTATTTQTNIQPDPFGASTASKLVNSGGSFSRLNYNNDIARFENKNFVWTFYVKGIDADNDSVSVGINTQNAGGASSIAFNNFTTEVVSGSGVVSNIQPSGKIDKIDNIGFGGTDTQNWTRVKVSSTSPVNASSKSNIEFRMYIGTYNTNVTNQSIFVSSWQIELSSEATDYQDPTDITHWQGNALVSSLSFDAGVEDNLTCSATFTGTGNVYPNGLGPELIGDTEFNLANDGSNPASAYWSIYKFGSGATTIIEDGYAKIITTSDDTSLLRSGLLVSGNYYLLTYTINTSTQGNIAVLDGWDSQDVLLPKTIGTHSVLIKPATSQLTIKRVSGATTIWLSSISLKKVL